jgi:hypothetical protein
MEPERRITLGDWLDLRDAMEAAEALLEDVEIAPTDLATYWGLSADLLALLQEIDEHLEQWREHGPGGDEAELHLGMQRRLRGVLAKAEEIGIAVADED